MRGLALPPSEANVRGAERVVKFLSNLREDDLVIMLISGGGSTLLYASRVLDKIKTENDDQKAGINIIRRALQAPLRQPLPCGAS